MLYQSALSQVSTWADRVGPYRPQGFADRDGAMFAMILLMTQPWQLDGGEGKIRHKDPKRPVGQVCVFETRILQVDQHNSLHTAT